MDFFVDLAYDSINKQNEELCGDKVEVVYTENSIIIVLADGLGSGVKANILATMTTKIAGTMLREGASIYETIETIASTLPVCNVRKLAYCTFIILKIQNDGKVYIVEYDNPPIFFIRKDKYMELNKTERKIHGKRILESQAQLQKGDTLILVSDGAIHAGVGGVLNLGWQWDNVAEYLLKQSKIEKCAKNISKKLIDTCAYLYDGNPGDDTSVVVVKIREPEVIQLFSGPPENKERDQKIIQGFMGARGQKIVCGGTAANIVSRETGKELIVDFETGTQKIPPMGRMEGINLVTEGVITLSKVLENIEKYMENILLNKTPWEEDSKNGASKLTKLLIEDCTHLNLWVGKAINPAHQNPDLPADLNIKIQVIRKLEKHLKTLGKKVEIQYF
ncbi:Stage II sporulation E family protein [Alkaliphilus metalliredigens QYMF]|uniref:Stage II sporulation E family protein n=1 Tax=Alkaliphilus metalliredigens (strain QYMF) TaxID=293826 RepID=A6TVD0_ALKMQ|nr:SpoIIE family protein phosphatase [Alkaliphilus metalliredigens]ABR50148.1 Stage II sporulation E family protein [Alkaliphilus metalliredigens QYMF]